MAAVMVSAERSQRGSGGNDMQLNSSHLPALPVGGYHVHTYKASIRRASGVLGTYSMSLAATRSGFE